ncbi:MAG: nucleotidyl transferase AbiEii/AbiGii toxin family protein [Bacteroidota bacterium]
MTGVDYKAQVDLLLSLLPHVAKQDCFALKGGTAINLFLREMPRLSVDIDLVYLPKNEDRETALHNIAVSLTKIEESAKRVITGMSVTHIPNGQGTDSKLNCQTEVAQVKIEVNTVTRGVVFPIRRMQLARKVQDAFGKFAEINLVAEGEIYGGKICAALDRQHPRDLFDVHQLFLDGGFTDEIFYGFLIFLISHNRPMHELISPRLQNLQSVFETQFRGMTEIGFFYKDYERTRLQLIMEIEARMTSEIKHFLLRFLDGNPDWNLFPLQGIGDLPAIRWKQLNINKLKIADPRKHTMQFEALRRKLEEAPPSH